MHQSSLNRMQWFVDQYASKEFAQKVLDVGSYDVNGSYKGFFNESIFEYVGLDMVSGPNVDYVPNSAYKWKDLETDEFDITISGQVLEHSEFFWITVSEIVRVTKQNGLICIIVPNGFNEHRHPVDCWRFWTDGLVALARYFNLKVLHAHTNAAPSLESKQWFSKNMADAMLIAKKPYTGNTQTIDLSSYICKPPIHEDLLGDLVLEPETWAHKERSKKKANSNFQTHTINSQPALSSKPSIENWQRTYPCDHNLRPSRINKIIEIVGAKTYLEIGLFKGNTFQRVKAEKKVGVDPDPNTFKSESEDIQTYQMTSDEYFARHITNPQTFDIIYLDGQHTFEQTLRDFNNSINFSHKSTVWIIDDTVPVNFASSLTTLEESSKIYDGLKHPTSPRPWMGTVYRLVYYIHDFLPAFSYMTYKGHGQTIIYKKPRINVKTVYNSMDKISSIDFNQFEYSKKTIMNFQDDRTIETSILQFFDHKKLKS